MYEDLFEAVRAGNYEQFGQLIDTLGINELNEAVVYKQGVECDTLLHAAIRRKNIRIVRAILSLNASVDLLQTNAAGETALELAVTLNHKECIACLTIRDKITQHDSQQNVNQTPINFNRVIALIQQGIDSFPRAIHQKVIYFIGSSGVGKSTVGNYLMGCDYTLAEDEQTRFEFAKHCNANVQQEVSEVGHQGISKTLLPAILHKPGLSNVYCDFGGLEDNRGIEERIAIGNSFKMINANAAKNFEGVVLMISYQQLSNREAGFINTYANFLERVIDTNTSPDSVDFENWISESTRVIVTKPSAGLSLVHERAALLRMIYSLAELPRRRGIVMLKKLLEKCVLENNYLMADVFYPAERQNLINSLGEITGSKKLVNFGRVIPEQARFNAVLIDIAEHYLEAKEAFQQTLPSRLTELNSELQEFQMQIEQANSIKQQKQIERQQPIENFDEAGLNQQISVLENEIQSSTQRVTQLQDQLHSEELMLTQIQKELQDKDSAELCPSDSTDVSFTRGARGSEIWDVGAQSAYPIYEAHRGDIHNTRGPGHGGITLKTAPVGTYEWTYRCASTHNNTVSAPVKFKTQKKLFYAAEITVLQQQIQNQSQLIRATRITLRQEQAQNTELRITTEGIRQQLVGGIAETARRNQRLDRDVEVLTQRIAEAEIVIAERTQERDTCLSDKAQQELLLIENKGLFETARNICRYLNMTIRADNLFWQGFDVLYQELDGDYNFDCGFFGENRGPESSVTPEPLNFNHGM